MTRLCLLCAAIVPFVFTVQALSAQARSQPLTEEEAAAVLATDSTHIFDLAQVTVLPRLRNAMEFQRALGTSYPPILRDAGAGGTVEVSFVLDQSGRVSEVEVVRSTDPR